MREQIESTVEKALN
ncbi:hypothetical protein BN188_700004 [Clostridioides difficile T19]|nr:hypothetical protein BN188_700004 [Clostridioides difficile T19]